MNGSQDKVYYHLTENDVKLIKAQAALRLEEATAMDYLKSALSAGKSLWSEKIGQEIIKQASAKLKSSLESVYRDTLANVSKSIKDPVAAKEIAVRALESAVASSTEEMLSLKGVKSTPSSTVRSVTSRASLAPTATTPTK